MSQIEALTKDGLSQEAAFKLFDELPPVSAEEMIGSWIGKEIPTGHPMDGLLTLCPWRGKQFVDSETVHPLVFNHRSGSTYYLNPDQIFKYINLILRSKILKKRINSEKTADPHAFDWLLKRFKTPHSKARLRVISYRNAQTAAMVYDHVAIIDVFKRIDENTLLGVMDVKHLLKDKSYFFLLEKDTTNNL